MGSSVISSFNADLAASSSTSGNENGLKDVDPFEDRDELDDLAEAGNGTVAELRFELPAGQVGERLDRVLARLLPDYSRSRIQQWIEEGKVTVDGSASRAKTIVLGGEEVVVLPQAVPQESAFQAEDIPLRIVFEDRAVMVLDKPAGLVVHPAAGNWSGTLLNGLLHHDASLAGVPRAGIVHRLDKDTSGLMVVARSVEAQTHLVRQLQARSVRRQYLALVWGEPYVSGIVDSAIGRHPRDRLRMATSTHPSAKPAVTHYRRIARGTLEKKPVSLMHCRLETGRTHQIRVHFQSIGFPLVGDPLYGKPHLSSVFPRQALHAWQLAFDHPLSGESMAWRADPPEDLRSLLERAGVSGWQEGVEWMS